MTDRLAELLGLPADAPHLEEALTHPSFANEQRSTRHNQRLEFLGDSVLGFCVSELLCARFPEADEGTLTRMRAQLVNAEALAAWARKEQLADVLRLGRGAGAAGLRDSTNVLADAVEALIAAVYLDLGLEAARASSRVSFWRWNATARATRRVSSKSGCRRSVEKPQPTSCSRRVGPRTSA